MFNKFVWGLYLQSGGSQVVKMFQDNLSVEMTQEYIDEIIRMRKTYCIMDDVVEEMRLQLQEVIKLDKEFGRDFGESDSVDSDNESVDYSDTLTEFYRNMLKECISDQAVFAEFSGGISFYTTNLSITFPEFFVPYYYRFNFNVLSRIAEAFEIELPEIPVKKDYKGRVLYYGEISRILLEFAKENSLSRYELCAFLYDFAPQYVGGLDSYIVKDLPAPRSAFFIGADRNDQFLAENHSEITSWQCSPDTRVGDMIVMYMRTPISAVDSIWRACSVGFIDPFFYYYRCVYISNPVKVKPFSLVEMRKDTIFKGLPIVRKNMQGINGVELYPSVYNHLLKVTGSEALSLEYEKTENDEEYTCEKDVENKLIKPLIFKLGYDAAEFEQQLYVEIGNHNKALIPDFVLLPDKTHGHISGFGIIEAKRSIPSAKVLKEVFVQARSYARVLSAKYCAVASKEKIWISQRRDDYEEIFFEATWKQLNNAHCFYELDKIIGK